MPRLTIGYARAYVRYVSLPKMRAALHRRPSVAYLLASTIDWEEKVVGLWGVLIEGKSGPISDALLTAWMRGDHDVVLYILRAAFNCYKESPRGGAGSVLPLSDRDAMFVPRIVYRDHGPKALAIQQMLWMMHHEIANTQ